ncbi:MAG: hypothetical protein LBN97_00755 [Oscillospiraceae bacterium]|jgi:hypothetical protein|nr:hypothetical protein [Oscillospiraceae bacterium]
MTGEVLTLNKTIDLGSMTNDDAIDALYDELLVRVIERKIERGEMAVKPLEIDENGNIVVDKDKDPELYDWAVNG